jgi:CheY-like chemotaxis protein
MEALGTLAGGIAHDFNNILTAILANVDLCQLELPDDHPTQSMLNEVTKASMRASDLVKRVLTVSRRQETSKAVVRLEPIIRDAVGLLRASLSKSIDIRVATAAETPPIVADATQMHQVVMNLGTNAGYAMAAAGGTMTITVDGTMLREGMDTPSVQLNPGSYVRLSVRDTGTGMSPSTLGRLFDPFFTTKGVEGTGLGLSVVHGIVQDHGGAIVVTSALGEGSRFDVWLPAAEGGEEEEAGTAPVRAGRGEHIMYVDDEEALVVAMSRALERLGYRCTGFTDPERALQAFRTMPHAFDAGLVDLAMPAMSGLELVRAIRAIRTDLPIAVTTGYAVEDADSLKRAGVVARLPKPVTKENLGRTLETLLSAAV